jgi:hypothetical protein
MGAPLPYLTPVTQPPVWLEYRTDYVAAKSSFSLIESGAFALVGLARDGSYAAGVPLYHAPVLAFIMQPSLFSASFTVDASPRRTLTISILRTLTLYARFRSLSLQQSQKDGRWRLLVQRVGLAISINLPHWDSVF